MTTQEEYEVADAVQAAVEFATDASGFDAFEFSEELDRLGFKIVPTGRRRVSVPHEGWLK